MIMESVWSELGLFIIYYMCNVFGFCRVDNVILRGSWLDESFGNSFKGIRENGVIFSYI